MVQDAKTTVVNIWTGAAYDQYIGRAGHGHDGYFGNPFAVNQAAGDRSECLEKFRIYFAGRLQADPEFRRRVAALKGKRLGCFCKPLSCHGDVIAEYLDSFP
jgi:hypothetical protein